MENRFSHQQESSGQMELTSCEVQLLNEPTTINCLSNSSVPPPSSSTCSSSKKVKICCQQSTKDRLRSTITKTSRKKVTKTKKKSKSRIVPASKIQPPPKPKSTKVLNKSTFDRLIEDNFITINLQDEILSLGSAMRQFEENKFNELTRFTKLFDERITPSKCDLRNNLLIKDLEKQTEIWVNALKHISSFKNIGINDQMLCIKRNFTDLCLVKSLIAIDPKTKTVQRNGFNVSLGKCPLMSDPKFLSLLSPVNNSFRCDPITNLLLVLICLFDANTPNLQSTFGVRKEYIITVHLMQKYLERNGLTTDRANSEISRFVGDLTSFLISFDAKKRFLNTKTSTSLVARSSQLLTEIMEIDEQSNESAKYPRIVSFAS